MRSKICAYAKFSANILFEINIARNPPNCFGRNRNLQTKSETGTESESFKVLQKVFEFG